jgi:hypothetical protein
VAARCDRGDATLTPAELDAFCRQRGVAGYLRTSALRGDGIDELVALMTRLVAWDERPATVTTSTFKRIKDFVLALKQDEAAASLILTPNALRAQLEASDPGWRFSDGEMTTAVGHLETYGYVRRLRTAAGESRILLKPELLNNLASSFVLEARRNPDGLGALDERRLLDGDRPYAFPELAGLSRQDRTILIDAATLLFLGHHGCFREIDLRGQSVLIFPELINLRRPPGDERATEEGASYTVVGAVENVFASLVVLLGYSNALNRVAQWHKNARYEVEGGAVCGFRQEGDRDGELDLVLCFSPDAPKWVRGLFENLVEGFLVRRKVVVKRYELVICSNGHPLNRMVVRDRLVAGKPFAFCNDCGAQIPIGEAAPRALPPAHRTELILAGRRTTFEQAVFRVAKFVQAQGRRAPTCFISYAWGVPAHERWVVTLLAPDLVKAGVEVILDRWHNEIGDRLSRFVDLANKADFVVVVGTPLYRTKFENDRPTGGYVVASEGDLISQRLLGSDERRRTVKPALLDGEPELAFPPLVGTLIYADFRQPESYFANALRLIFSLHRIKAHDPAVADLVTSLDAPLPSTAP